MCWSQKHRLRNGGVKAGGGSLSPLILRMFLHPVWLFLKPHLFSLRGSECANAICDRVPLPCFLESQYETRIRWRERVLVSYALLHTHKHTRSLTCCPLVSDPHLCPQRICKACLHLPDLAYVEIFLWKEMREDLWWIIVSKLVWDTDRWELLAGLTLCLTLSDPSPDPWLALSLNRLWRSV